ncbi:MAG TPA: dipeptidase [Bryobacteraceae bacterium]|jgi:membrane dipeptidase|nr:dipeptidase [Bryobacteraceae bacterium]
MRLYPALFLICAGLLCGQTPARTRRTVTDAEVMRVHNAAILIDTHNDITGRTVTGFDIGKPSTSTMTDLPRMKKGGMGAQFFAVYVAADYTNGNHSAKRTLDMIDTVKHDIIGRYPNDFMFATTAADIREAHRRHKIAALMGIEGGHAIEDDLRLLRVYYDEGVRYMTLTHSNSNHWADSSGDPNKPNNGLTPFGKDVVREMNRLGMIVDISHVSDKTFRDALETSKAPIFASHSSARAITEVPRNMTDDMIVALAKKGGVIQINFSCGFLNAKAGAAEAAQSAKMAPMLAALREKYKNKPDELEKATDAVRQAAGPPSPRATLADVVKHINHVADIAGVDAIGLGSDFDGIGCAPEGLDSVDKWPNLTRALLEEGYSQSDIVKIYGENTLRLMTQVEKVAASLKQ